MPQKDGIQIRLKSIEGKLDKMSKRSAIQWVYSIGYGGMIASLAIFQYNHGGAITVYILSFLLMILTPILIRKS
jgi:hypothetical protein